MIVDTYSASKNISVEGWREHVKAEYKAILEAGAIHAFAVIHKETNEAQVDVLTIFYALPAQSGGMAEPEGEVWASDHLSNGDEA